MNLQIQSISFLGALFGVQLRLVSRQSQNFYSDPFLNWPQKKKKPITPQTEWKLVFQVIQICEGGLLENVLVDVVRISERKEAHISLAKDGLLFYRYARTVQTKGGGV